MNWQTHILLGAVLSAFVFYFLFNVYEPFLLGHLVFISAISSLLPDLDHEMSKGKKIADVLMIFFAAFFALATNSLIIFFAVLGFYFIVFKLFKPKHRTVTHRLFFCVLLSLAVLFLTGFNFAFAFFLGYLSHLIVDQF